MAVKMKRSAQGWYTRARYFLLAELILTVINCICYVAQLGSYYLVSVYSAYTFFDLDAGSILITLVILTPFVLAFVFSKKNPKWMLVALILQILDTLFIFVAIAIVSSQYDISDAIGSDVLDIVVHIVGIVFMALAVKNGKEALQAQTALETGAPAGFAQDGTPIAPEIECNVGINDPSETGLRAKMNGGAGVVRFENGEIVVGARDLATQFVAGNLGSMKERARFTPGMIRNITNTNKSGTNMNILLATGVTVTLVFSKPNRDLFAQQLARMGVAVPVPENAAEQEPSADDMLKQGYAQPPQFDPQQGYPQQPPQFDPSQFNPPQGFQPQGYPQQPPQFDPQQGFQPQGYQQPGYQQFDPSADPNAQ